MHFKTKAYFQARNRFTERTKNMTERHPSKHTKAINWNSSANAKNTLTYNKNTDTTRLQAFGSSEVLLDKRLKNAWY